MHDYDITGGSASGPSWHANFALIDKDVCPIKRDGDGNMKKAETGLVYASMDMQVSPPVPARERRASGSGARTTSLLCAREHKTGRAAAAHERPLHFTLASTKQG